MEWVGVECDVTRRVADEAIILARQLSHDLAAAQATIRDLRQELATVHYLLGD